MGKTLLVMFMLSVALSAVAQFDNNSDIFYNGGGSSSTNVFSDKGIYVGKYQDGTIIGGEFGSGDVIIARAPVFGGGGKGSVNPGGDPNPGTMIPVGSGVAVFSLLGVAYLGLRNRKKSE